jgi:Na+-driven multidrug efflux pump
MFLVQIVLNNLMKSYGEKSVYGITIPIACIGIVMKVNMIFMAIVIGVAQGTQPIISYNYGAKDYKRVRSAYRKAAKVVVIISVAFFAIFQLMPKLIIMLFIKDASAPYLEFGVMCFRIYLFMTFINGIQPLTSTFFTSIGKAKKGALIALTRQVIFLIPVAVILPKFMGIKGIMYAAPIADLMAIMLIVLFVTKEFKLMRREELNK